MPCGAGVRKRPETTRTCGGAVGESNRDRMENEHTQTPPPLTKEQLEKEGIYVEKRFMA